ncbi:MAG: LacI family DNA-binding transcriptional regulator [Oscillospiraceae bacterium]|nr:LacI family DNA-binding transcriptional regulator [Oscillospiraceae bacterium]MDD4369115.1 LacI family DNA-binding transcriptional regulator [Oscillospiraceae bacterium]
MVTIKDVARDAGVSVGTVSNVLNGSRVSEERRLRVEASIQKLGYQVNTLARGLKTHKTDYVVVILPNLTNPFFSLLLAYLEKTLTLYHKQIVLCISDAEKNKELHFIELARRNKIDGVIGITYTNIDDYIDDSMAFVSIDRHFHEGIHVVSADNFEGGKLAAATLYERGSRNLLSFQTLSSLSTEVRKRQQGFEAWCSEHQVSYSCNTFSEDQVKSVYSSYGSQDLIANVLRAYLGSAAENRPKVDGIFASSDHLALAICEEIQKFGLRIPEDVQVIGFDGLRILNQGEPLVSSIEQPVPAIAEAAVDMLLKLLNHENVENVTNLPVRFLEGWSTRPRQA